MKFLCPSCKAKYQIADEKVAGRSVRMKCRKCGYVIQVSSVTGLGDALPGSEPPPANTATEALSDASAVPPVALVPTPVAAELPEEPPPARVPFASSTSLPGGIKKPAPARPSPSIVRPATAANPIAKAPLAGAKAPPPKSSPVKPAPLAPASAPAATTSALPLKFDTRTIQGGTAAPLPAVAAKPARVVAPAPAPAPAPANPFAAFDDEEDESTRIADVGALAGAFSRAVGDHAEPPPDSLSMPADEWFVGINGVPVGPIRLSELRSKAASGSINAESLVWRDGFEDWRPLKTFPELLAIVDEGVSSARASLTPFTPSVATTLGPAEVVAATSNAAFAVAGVTTPDPFAAAPAGATGAAVVTDDLEAAGVYKRSGSSPAAWIAVGMALLFGLTIGFVLFNKGQGTPREVIRYVDRPVPGAASGVVAAAPGEKVAASDEANAPSDPKNPAKHVSGTAKTSAGSTGAAEPDKGITGLKGLQGLSSLGPKTGPDISGPSGAVQGTGQLDGSQIQSTVARYTGSVKRACWQPALDTRDRDAPTTARVSVAITVMPSGSVSNAAVGADPKGYRGLAQCISSRVRGWQFPPSGDSTTVNVPFVFAAQ
ncbi:MAG: GYF domain-containing protein [Pseudomonadota bacterium]